MRLIWMLFVLFGWASAAFNPAVSGHQPFFVPLGVAAVAPTETPAATTNSTDQGAINTSRSNIKRGDP
jgi:hypothetical protein